MAGVNLNQIFEQDDVHAFLDFLEEAGSKKNVRLMFPAFEEFLSPDAKECKALITFINSKGNTDFQFLINSYRSYLERGPQTINFHM